MPTISKDGKVLSLINIFTVEPAKQRELVDLLIRATQTSVRHVTGFVSAALHRSLGGPKVAMNAQSRSIGDYQALGRAPVASPGLDQAPPRAKFEPALCEVAETFTTAAAYRALEP